MHFRHFWTLAIRFDRLTGHSHNVKHVDTGLLGLQIKEDKMLCHGQPQMNPFHLPFQRTNPIVSGQFIDIVLRSKLQGLTCGSQDFIKLCRSEAVKRIIVRVRSKKKN